MNCWAYRSANATGASSARHRKRWPPTATVRSARTSPCSCIPDTNEEYALARTERKTAAGYHGFDFHTSPDVTIEEDLARRDLTINAMARNSVGDLIDPFNGSGDIERRILRHVSEAFAEDPVTDSARCSICRRFADAGFTVAEETLGLMRHMVENGEVDALVPDRVWKETERALAENIAAGLFRSRCDPAARCELDLPGNRCAVRHSATRRNGTRKSTAGYTR